MGTPPLKNFRNGYFGICVVGAQLTSELLRRRLQAMVSHTTLFALGFFSPHCLMEFLKLVGLIAMFFPEIINSFKNQV